MNKVGVKVYHVDARAAFFENKTRPVSYVSSGGYSKSTYRIGLAHSNTVRNTSEFTKYPLYELMPKDGVTSFLNGGSATNETLFYEGDSFGITTYQDFKFHDGSDLFVVTVVLLAAVPGVTLLCRLHPILFLRPLRVEDRVRADEHPHGGHVRIQ